jgi:multidrug efflux pump subunit AcrA (membrane-fusion protein)
VLLGLICFCAVFLVGCRAGDNAAVAAPALIAPMMMEIRSDTAVVSRGPVVEVSQHTGIVRSAYVPVSFGTVSGVNVTRYVQPGDTVTEGQLLAKLDTEALEERIRNQEQRIRHMDRQNEITNEITELELGIQALENTRAMNQAAENFDEAAMEQALQREHAILQAWYDLELTKERQAHLMQRERVFLARLYEQLAAYSLFAPFDGTVINIPVFAHEDFIAPFTHVMYLSPHDGDVFIELVGVQPPHVERAARIHVHAEGSVYPVTHLILTPAQRIRYDDNARPMRFSFDTETPPLAGTFVLIYVYTHWYEDAVRVPRQALYHDPEAGDYVYRVVDNIRVMTPVVVGARTQTFVSILGGIEEGEVIHVGV